MVNRKWVVDLQLLDIESAWTMLFSIVHVERLTDLILSLMEDCLLMDWVLEQLMNFEFVSTMNRPFWHRENEDENEVSRNVNCWQRFQFCLWSRRQQQYI